MGAAHSNEPRSVSMDNPTTGVIDVSDEVVQRLKKGLRKQAEEKAVAPSPKPKPLVKKEKPAPPAKVAKPPVPAPPPTIVYQNAAPIYIPSGGPTMSAVDVRRQMEHELQQNDTMWQQRMAELEETLKKTNSILEQEYSAAVEDVRKRFATAAPAHQLPPCQDLKAQLIACYRAHPGETLKCHEEVNMFRDCVSSHRIKKLDAEAEPKASSDAVHTSGNKPLAKAG